MVYRFEHLERNWIRRSLHPRRLLWHHIPYYWNGADQYTRVFTDISIFEGADWFESGGILQTVSGSSTRLLVYGCIDMVDFDHFAQGFATGPIDHFQNPAWRCSLHRIHVRVPTDFTGQDRKHNRPCRQKGRSTVVYTVAKFYRQPIRSNAEDPF